MLPRAVLCDLCDCVAISARTGRYVPGPRTGLRVCVLWAAMQSIQRVAPCGTVRHRVATSGNSSRDGNGGNGGNGGKVWKWWKGLEMVERSGSGGKVWKRWKGLETVEKKLGDPFPRFHQFDLAGNAGNGWERGQWERGHAELFFNKRFSVSPARCPPPPLTTPLHCTRRASPSSSQRPRRTSDPNALPA